MNRLKLRYVYVLLLIVTLQSCGTCSQHHVNSGGAGVPQVSHGREVWSTLSDVGYPIIPDTIASKMQERNCYTVSHNKNTRQPNWVMWQLTGEHVMNKKDGVWSDYREDEELPAEERATLDDYASSGYDRGHMCPGGDCNWDDKGRDETFVLSNMCPQNPNLNRGDWKEIENACRKWAQKYGSIYIVCGPMFFKSQEHERIGPNQIPIPEAFFKVVLCVDDSAPKGLDLSAGIRMGTGRRISMLTRLGKLKESQAISSFPIWQIPSRIWCMTWMTSTFGKVL